MGRLEDHVNENKHENSKVTAKTGTKTFYRKFNQFIWKFFLAMAVGEPETTFRRMEV